ncbi:hypothetical protein Taro_049820 [Colocasia esculenta]|uniref:Uncharacterized protein n=1 Tax=Colocasia esculenta TaxID=4460 RepID=A0A843XC63_COLES|nr:hypothetical protein [Colocasia esculenta]
MPRLVAFWGPKAKSLSRRPFSLFWFFSLPSSSLRWGKVSLFPLLWLELADRRRRLVCGARASSWSEEEAAVVVVVWAMPTVCLPADVVTAECVVTSEKASPRPCYVFRRWPTALLEVSGRGVVRACRSQRLVRWKSGLCVLLLAAYGGGLCALVVTKFLTLFLRCLVQTPNCCFSNLFLGAARGGTEVCSSLTSWHVRGAGWFCLWALDLVKFLLLWLVRDWLSLLSLVREAHPPTLFRWLAFQQGPSVSCRRVLLLLLGVRAMSVVAIFACAAVGFVFGLCVRVGSASLLELSRCLVCHVAPLVEHCDTCRWLLPALCWLVVNSGEVLPEFFSVCSGGELFVVVLVRVPLPLGLFLCLLKSSVVLPLWFEVSVVLVRVALRTNGALVVLVEDLPEPVVWLPLAVVFSLLAVCFGCLFGLRSGDVFPERLLELWVEVLPKLPCVCFGRVVPLAVCLAVVLASLVSAGGVWLVVLLWKCQFHFVVSPCMWKRLVWCIHMAFDAVSRTVVTFAAKGSVPCLCLEALIVVWRMALSACGGFAAGVACSALFGLWLLAGGFWQHHMLVLEWFVLCRMEPGCIVWYLGWLLVALLVVDVLPSTFAVVSFHAIADVVSCLALPTSDVFFSFASMPVPVEQAWQADLSGCRGIPSGRILVDVWAAVVLRVVTRRPAASCFGGRRLKALVGAPSPSFGSSLFPPPLRGVGRFPFFLSDGYSLAKRRRLVCGAGASSWSEEEAAMASIPAVCLPTDVVTAERVATSEKVSPWLGVTLSRVGRRPFWRFPEGVPCVPVVTVTWDPQPHASVSEGVSPGGGHAQALFRCGPASPSHCLALRWFQSRVGRSQRLASWRSGLCALVVMEFLKLLLSGRACGEMVLLTWLLGVSRGDTWLFLPDLVEVRDVGACVSSFASALLEFLLLWLAANIMQTSIEVDANMGQRPGDLTPTSSRRPSMMPSTWDPRLVNTWSNEA